jgi:ATP-binding protein involved in chromosome partitioning
MAGLSDVKRPLKGLLGILGGKPEAAVAATPLVLDEAAVKNALKVVVDPDLDQDIVSLGFVKVVSIDAGKVHVEVNLTTPACPVKEQMKAQSEAALRALPGVQDVTVTMTATTRGGTKTAQTAPTLAGVKNIIAVAAGKGGVGKSTSAVNLAYALARTGAKVGLLDADVYGPSVPRMVSIDTPSGAQDGMVVPPQAAGVKIVSLGMFQDGDKAAMLRGPMAGNVIKQFLTQVVWGELDYLLIDYPPGTGDIQLTISQTAPVTGAVMVTTPQEVSLLDVRKAVQLFKTMKVPVLGVIETMSWFECDSCSKQHHIFRKGGGERLARELGVSFLGGIPLDPVVAEGGDSGRPAVLQLPDSSVAKAYMAAAGTVARQLSILNAQDAEGGGLKRFSMEWKQ